MKIPTAMDDSSVSHHNGGQVGSQIGVSVNNKQNDEPSQSVQYSIPGILHFIQHEWARFELERSQWEVDRAEFEARIAFLQGERKGQENLKNDLVRRIKMLEYALKQERAKFHKLKYGVELQQGDVRPPPEELPAEPEPAERATWKQGRQLIKQYLQEIGYTDTILDVRSNRVRTLLGLNNEEGGEDPNYRGYDKQRDRCDHAMNHLIIRKYDYGGKDARKGGVSTGGGYNEEGLSVQETAAVFANFEFLANQEMDMDEIDDLDAKQAHHNQGKQGTTVYNYRFIYIWVGATIGLSVQETAADFANFEFLANQEMDMDEIDDLDAKQAHHNQGKQETAAVFANFEFLANQQMDMDEIDDLDAKQAYHNQGKQGLSVQETAAVFANFEFLANQEMDMDVIDDLDAKQAHHNQGKQGLWVQETAAVFANFEFLANQEMDMDEIDDLDAKQAHHNQGQQGEEVDHEAEEVLNELNLLTESEPDDGGQGDEYGSAVKFPGGASVPATATAATGGAGEADEEPLALGELAQLTVSNEPEAYDVNSANKESFRKTWNAKYTLRSHFDGLTVSNEPEAYDVNSANKESFRKTWNAKYTLRSHFDGVRALAFHPTEAALVTASEDHTLKLWNLQRTVPAKKSAGLDVEPLYTFRAHTAPVLCLAMGAPSAPCRPRNQQGWTWSPSTPSARTPRQYSASPWARPGQYTPPAATSSLRQPLTFLPTEAALVTASEDHTLQLWNLQCTVPAKKSAGLDVEPLYTFRAHTAPVLCLAMGAPSAPCRPRSQPGWTWSPSTPSARTPRQYSASPWARPGQYTPPAATSRPRQPLTFHPTDAALVAASEDHTLKLWNLQRTVPAKKSAGLDVEPLYTFRAHTAPVLCLAMGAPRSEECFSGGLDGTIRVWNLPPPTADPYDPYDPAVQGPVLRDHTDAVWSLASAHGRLLSSSADGTARLWAPRAARPLLQTLRADDSPNAPIPAAADFADAGARAAVVYRDGALLMYDLETAQLSLCNLLDWPEVSFYFADDSPNAPIPAAADFADAGARAAVVYRDGALLMYDLETAQVSFYFADDSPNAPIPTAADFADAGARAAVVYRDGALLMYDLETAQLSNVTYWNDDSPNAPIPAAADFADAGARAAVVYRDGALLMYDLETAQPVLRVACDSGAWRVRAHPTLPLLVTAHEDRHIRFWDAVSGRLAHAMVAHLDAVTGLALDPNGLFLLSGSHDCSVRLWNLDTKTCVQEITAHRKKFDESIMDVAFHPLRPYIASAGADGLAKVFV
ncbi:striatin family domain-containing protein [Phthorimaea operculella]|nr:striatin family domain-containing protein [Phthorimaea operculella]